MPSGNKNQKAKSLSNSLTRQVINELKQAGYHPANNRPPNSSRRRRGRGGGRKAKMSARNARGRNAARPERKNVSLPLSVGNITRVTEATLVVTELVSKEYGPGATISFGGQVGSIAIPGTNVSSNVSAKSININPGTHMAGGTDGFTFAAYPYSSGAVAHPFYLTSRLANEAVNWSFFRFKWIRYIYQTSVGSGSTGLLTMAWTYDPTAFIEAGGNQITPLPVSVTNMSQSVPASQSNIWVDNELRINHFGPQIFPMEVVAPSNSGESKYIYQNDIANLAYDRTAFPGRISIVSSDNIQIATTVSIGTLWVEGELEVFRPTSNLLSVGYFYTTPTSFLSKEDRNLNTIGRRSYCVDRKLGSVEEFVKYRKLMIRKERAFDEKLNRPTYDPHEERSRSKSPSLKSDLLTHRVLRDPTDGSLNSVIKEIRQGLDQGGVTVTNSGGKLSIKPQSVPDSWDGADENY